MNSTVKNSVTMLPGFDNVEAEQHGRWLSLLIPGTAAHSFNREDYDCDPSFIYDVNAWAVRNGGIRVPQ